MDRPQDLKNQETLEVALDLHGRKHVLMSDNEDKLTCFAGEISTKRFLLESVETMREYLDLRLPCRYMRDEYGNRTTIAKISSRHLASLQAVLWRECPRMGAKLMFPQPPVERPSWSEQQTAHSVFAIAERLSRNHVFILRERSASWCSFPLCQQIRKSIDAQYQPYKIALEPIVAFETLECVNAEDLFGKHILIYRRKPHDLFDVKPFLTVTTTLCAECLFHIWNERYKSWWLLDNDADTSRKLERELKAQNDICPGVHILSNKDSDAEGGIILPPLEVGNDEDRETPFSLDGAKDNKRFPLITPTPFKIWEDTEEELGHHGNTPQVGRTSPITPHPVPANPSSSFTHNVGPAEIPRPSRWTAINLPKHAKTRTSNPDRLLHSSEEHFLRRPTKMGPTAGKAFQGTFSMSEEEKYPNAHGGISTGPERSHEYKPGIVFPAPPIEDLGLISSDSLPHEAAPHRVGQYFTGLTKDKCCSPAKPSANLPTVPPDVSRLQANADSCSRLHPQSRGRSLYSPKREYRPIQSGDLSPDLSPAPSTDREPPKSPHIMVTARRAVSEPQPTRRSTQTTGKTGLSMLPIAAKPHLKTTDPVDKRYPSTKEIICRCRKRAGTFTCKIVECRDLDCKVGWYHYACLEKGAKLSSLHGMFTCDTCRAEKSWGVSHEVSNMAAAFSGQEMADFLEGASLGAYPYGLGQKMEVSGGGKPVQMTNGPQLTTELEHGAPQGVQEGGLCLTSNQIRDERVTEANNALPNTEPPAFTPGALSQFGYTPSHPPWICYSYNKKATTGPENLLSDEYTLDDEDFYDDEHFYDDEDIYDEEVMEESSE